MVRNPRQVSVVIDAPGASVYPRTFGYDIRRLPGPGGAARLIARDSSTLVFRPFETKPWLFEFKVASELNYQRDELSQGRYLVSGDYMRHRTWGDTITVTR